MKIQELNEITGMLPMAATKLINELPGDFFGRVILIFEAGKVRRMEMQQSFHLKEAGRRETN